jgi:hypothetical protein
MLVVVLPHAADADSFADETTVLPGHMGITTIGQERATNPFMQDLPSVS